MKRRVALGAGALAVGGGWLGGVSSVQSAQTTHCAPTPDFAVGPFYVRRELVRSDVTEGLPGVPLVLELVLIDAELCRPMAGLPVDIWLASPTGEYSGVDNAIVIPGGRNTAGRSFLRGTQFSDEQGSVRFRAVYPGWYPVTPPHLHFAVRVDAQRAFTSQFFFDDVFSERLYTSADAYRQRGAHIKRIGWPIPDDLIVVPDVMPDGGLALRRVIGIRRSDLAATCGFGDADCLSSGLWQSLRDFWRIIR